MKNSTADKIWEGNINNIDNITKALKDQNVIATKLSEFNDSFLSKFDSTILLHSGLNRYIKKIEVACCGGKVVAFRAFVVQETNTRTIISGNWEYTIYNTDKFTNYWFNAIYSKKF
jgi:hypothetical protein